MPYGAWRWQVMKRLIVLALLAVTVAFAGTALADGGTLQDRELQKLFEWSAQAVEAAKQKAQIAGPAAQPTREIPPVMEHRGSQIK
jgi:hypothetical protein